MDADKGKLSVLPEITPEWNEADFSTLPESEQATALGAYFQQQSERGFDFDQGQLLRAYLIRQAEDKHTLLLTAHHIIVDGMSLEMLFQQIGQAYSALCQDQALAENTVTQWADYLQWKALDETQTKFAEQKAYWLNADLKQIPVLDLPTDKPYPAMRTYQGDRYSDQIPTEFYAALKTISQQQGCTAFMGLLAIYLVLLHRISGQDEFLIGIPVSGRNLPGGESLSGYCTHILPIYSQLQPEQTFVDFLQALRNRLLMAYENQDYPYAELIQALDLPRSSSHVPLVSAIFNLDKAAQMPVFEGLSIERLELPQYRVAFDLSINLTEIGDALFLECDYNTDILTEQTAARWMKHFGQLLAAVVEQPQQLAAKLNLMDTADIALLQSWNDTATDYPKDQTIVSLFEQQVQKTPENTAVIYAAQQLTYSELNQKANQLAHYLIEQGVKADTLVAIYAERSLEMVIGLLGILKAGGAYVPLDPSYPAERLKYMLEDSQVKLLLTQTHLQDSSLLKALNAEPVSVPKVVWLDETGLYQDKSSINPELQNQPDDLAYVIYTSGSTGKPKGVLIAHQSLSNHTLWQQALFGFTADDKFLQKTAFSFDAASSEFYSPLIIGATLHMALAGKQSDIAYLYDVIATNKITVFQAVPVLLNAILEACDLGKTQLRHVFCAGEALAPQTVQKFYDQTNGLVLHNIYGPTEATIDATAWPCVPGVHPLIGRPIPNTRIYILDSCQQALPPGIPGEMCIAGTGLARGYLNRPELTAEKFIEVELFGKTERIYKTGDLARWLPDGNLEYLGRIDHQIKLRGFRIELGEIESVLGEHAAVQRAIVQLYEKGGNKSLVAYLTLVDEHHDLDELRQALRSLAKTRLPDYMMPISFTVIDKWPLTPNGKINYRALPEPEVNLASEYAAPGSQLEQQLVAAWSSVLKREKIGIQDNFFDLGGDSILGIQIVFRLRREGLELKSDDIFRHQTIAELAASLLESQQASDVTVSSEVTDEPFGLSPIQQWFFAQDFAKPDHWNQAAMFHVAQEVTDDHLRNALKIIQTQHPVLNLQYAYVDGVWQQSYQDPQTLPFSVLDLTNLENGAWQQERQAIIERTQAGLSLEDGKLWQACLLITPAGQQLLWVIHHLVVDGVSWRILLDDLQNLCQQQLSGQSVQQLAKQTSFQYWLHCLANYSDSTKVQQDAAYWQRLAGSNIKPLPQDGTSVQHNTVADQQLHQTAWSDDLTRDLLEVSRRHQIAIEMLLLTAFVSALAEWQNTEQVYFDLEGHGRHIDNSLPDVSQTVGWFTSLYPVLVDLTDTNHQYADEDPLLACLKSVKSHLQAVPTQGLSYGLLRYLGKQNDQQALLTQVPRAQLVFNYLGQLDSLHHSDDLLMLSTEPVCCSQGESNQRAYLLEVDASIQGGQLQIAWHYNANAHRLQTIENLQTSLLEKLAGICSALNKQDSQIHTASDFPLARLTPDNLADIFNVSSDIEDIYPLSSTQEGLLFHHLHDESSAYFQQVVCHIQGEINVEKFTEAWQLIIQQHPILRTSFAWQGVPQPLQLVHKYQPLAVQIQDWRNLDTAARNRAWNDLLAEDLGKSYALNALPLMRLYLCHYADDEHRLLWSHSHILSDGWSSAIVFEQLFRFYRQRLTEIEKLANAANPQLLPAQAPYRHFIEWLEQHKADKNDEIAFWRTYLDQFGDATLLPFQQEMPPRAGADSSSRSLDLPLDLTEQLQVWAREHQVTMNNVFQAIWALVLHHYSQTNDIVFGVVFSGRPTELADVEQMVGLFLNTLPLRLAITPDQSLVDWLDEVHKAHTQLSRYETTSQGELQRYINRTSQQPLFESVLIFENYPIDAASQSIADSGLQVTEAYVIERNHYPLSVEIAQSPEQAMSIKLTYNIARFDAAQIDELLAHMQILLEAILDKAHQRVSGLPKPQIAGDELVQDEQDAFLQAAMAIDEDF